MTQPSVEARLQPNPPRKHHYLPEFYTKKWVGISGHLIRYTLVPGGKVAQKRVAPGAVGFQRDLYTLPLHESDRAQALELELFSEIDNRGAAALERIVRGDIPPRDPGRTAFATFVLSLRRRTPDAIESAVGRVAREMEDKFEIRPEYQDGLRWVALMRLYHIVKKTSIGQDLINMDWSLIETPASNVSLLTSDNPLILYGGTPIATGHPWIPTSDLESFALPVSPNKLLIGYWPARGPIGLARIPPSAAAKAFNKYIVEHAKAFVIAADERQSAFVRKYFGDGRGA